MSMSIDSILRQKGADVATIAPEASVKRATSWLHAKNVGSLVVTSGSAVVGLISEREIVHAIARYGETAISMPVSEIMRHGVITVSPTDTVSHVMSLMTRHRVRHMPVLRAGNLVGVISIGDVGIDWRIWNLRRTSYVMSTTPRVEGSGVDS
jgi:CBS domain-containing protein